MDFFQHKKARIFRAFFVGDQNKKHVIPTAGRNLIGANQGNINFNIFLKFKDGIPHMKPFGMTRFL